MPLPSYIHLLTPSTPSITSAPRTYLIYYVTGNPGLIEYYRVFLTHLFGLLQTKYSASSTSVDFEIYGRSLPGFEIDDSSSAVKNHVGKPSGPPYNVKQQIEMAKEEVRRIVKAARANGKKDVRVILMGHSFGTYMSLEIMRELREEVATHPEPDHVRVVGGVLLFATVMHLAKSPSGLRLGWLFGLPNFARLVSVIAKCFTFFIPTAVLAVFIRMAMIPGDAARVVAEFVKSKHGVEQALFLANDELTEISLDKWDAVIWGAVHPSFHPHGRPTLRFLFAKSDHWVADQTRDELIRARGANGREQEEWKPKMDVDEEEGWPHGFCIEHSIPVAERACKYIEDIVEKDLESLS